MKVTVSVRLKDSNKSINKQVNKFEM